MGQQMSRGTYGPRGVTRSATYCAGCESELHDGSGGQSLPIDNNGDVVANDYAGEWAGRPCCRTCYDVHKAAGPVALEAHVKATADLSRQLEDTRAKLAEVRNVAQLACDFLNID